MKDSIHQDTKGIWGEHEVFSKEYNQAMETLRQKEYPHMANGCYLDHGGATIYAKSTIDAFSKEMLNNLYGNPHSMNTPAKESGEMVDRIREKTLRFLGADPEHYDLVFVANATAAIKLVADAFRDIAEKANNKKFWYGYHKDAHTSLVGIREFSGGMHHCFESDESVNNWLAGGNSAANHPESCSQLGLFAYPGQSNMTGRRLPVSWVDSIRKTRGNTFTLFDAAALAMTSDLSTLFADPISAPDFTCLSFYKIFGFPDLGGLIVRKESGHILTLRKYFGGGTVTAVSVLGGSWHNSKGLQEASNDYFSIHDGVEDGTLPFHSILALGEAIDVQKRLYGSMKMVSRHTSHLVRRLRAGLGGLRHGNGKQVIEVYGNDADAYGDSQRHGGTIAFNITRANGTYIPYTQVEKVANEKGFYIRSGGVCCPGGLVTALGYEPWELLRALSAGHGCGYKNIDIVGPKPTGIVRASLGAMTTLNEVESFINFLADEYVDTTSGVKIPRRPVAFNPVIASEAWMGAASLPEIPRVFGSVLAPSQSGTTTPAASISDWSYSRNNTGIAPTDLPTTPTLRGKMEPPTAAGLGTSRKRERIFGPFRFKSQQAKIIV